MTATRIVAGTLATRDFMPITTAVVTRTEQVAPNIFMNIISTNAYCSPAT